MSVLVSVVSLGSNWNFVGNIIDGLIVGKVASYKLILTRSQYFNNFLFLICEASKIKYSAGDSYKLGTRRELSSR